MGGGRNYAQLREDLRRCEQGDINYRQMDEAAAQVAVGAEGLVYRVGSRRETRLREGFTGRTELSSVGHQTRAVMEGILLDLHAHRPPLEASGPGFMVGAGKGLQNSQVWTQMAADLFGCPIKVTNFENAVWAAAVIAAVGVGAIQSVRDAIAMIAYSRELTPDTANTARYRDLIAQRSETMCET
jgi:xylulokinase